MKVLSTSWGGRGEHGILEVYMDMNEDGILLSLHEVCYNDWGGKSQIVSEKTFSKEYVLESERLTKKYLYGCILDFAWNDCGLTYYKIREENIMGPW